MRCSAYWGIGKDPLHYVVEFTQAEVEELIINKKKGISVVLTDAILGKKVYNLLAEEYETAKVKGLDK
tara:strand:- start:717 stop:920 length:204 start_codon:yes stop_codon:yes gene_type:complete